MRTSNTWATAEKWFDPHKYLKDESIYEQLKDYFRQTHIELAQKISDYARKEDFLFELADGNPLVGLSYFFFTKFLFTDGVLAREDLEIVPDFEKEHAKAATINYIMKAVILMVSLMKGCAEKFGEDRSVPRKICTRFDGKTSILEGQIQLFTPRDEEANWSSKNWSLTISLDYAFDDFWEAFPLRLDLKCERENKSRTRTINFPTTDFSYSIKEFSWAIKDFVDSLDNDRMVPWP